MRETNDGCSTCPSIVGVLINLATPSCIGDGNVRFGRSGAHLSVAAQNPPIAAAPTSKWGLLELDVVIFSNAKMRIKVRYSYPNNIVVALTAAPKKVGSTIRSIDK